MPLHLPRALQAPFAALTCTAGVLVTGCGSDVAAFDFNAPTGQFGTPAAPDSGSIDGGTASDSDGNVSDGGGPTVMVRVVHGMPNVGALVLCRFPALRLDDPSTPADELERDNTTGELVTDVGPLAVGLSFGEVSQWVRLRIADTGVLSLHRAPTPEPADAGIPSDAGGRDAGLADASTAHDASADASAPAAMPCDPASLEAALPLPLPDDWLLPPAAPPPMTPAVDAGLADAGATPDDGATDAALPSLSDQLAARGIASSFSGATQLTLFASGLALSPNALATALQKQGAASIHAADLAFGPRLLASEKPSAPRNPSFSLSLVHLVPDVLAGGVAPASLRACITVDGVEGRAVPALSAAPVAFRERVSLASELATAARYRIRVFAADDFATPGQDCANTTRAPIATLDAPAGMFSAGTPYTLAVSGLSAPETLCGASAGTGLARAGCFGTGDHTVRATLLSD